MSEERLPAPPEGARRRRVGGAALHDDSVELRTVTPVLGGAARTRTVDQVDFIRAPTVRGHLRFWWRALYAVRCQDEKELRDRERALWGGMGVGDEGPVRSQVDLRVIKVRKPEQPEPNHIHPKEAYALWPARGESRSPNLDRCPPGLAFCLEWRVPERIDDRNTAQEVEAAVRAWLLFGGYGSRTRRGCGSLTVEKDSKRWLPATAAEADLEKLFSHAGLRFIRPYGAPGDTPSLHGARLYCDGSSGDARGAWHEALGWLRDFRQREAGSDTRREWFARLRGGPMQPKGWRPGRSLWPEPDKVRHIMKTWPQVHEPNYGPALAWPRAGFGLPIQIHFQHEIRNGNGKRYHPPEPANFRSSGSRKDDKGFVLLWHRKEKEPACKQELADRLASPLIVKPLALADGAKCIPLALWLHRRYPVDAEVVLLKQGEKQPIENSGAPFDRLLGDGDTALYEPLREKDLRTAFFTWLEKRPRPPAEHRPRLHGRSR